jgi:uncharacterized DUF497 family protein
MKFDFDVAKDGVNHFKHIWRDTVARMISVRRSNAGEQRDYDSNPG